MMQQRRAARRSAALSVAQPPSVPTSPLYSSKRLVRRISQAPGQAHDGSSSGSSSPDSLYSNSSPTLPDPAFEFDGGEQIQEHDEAEYESLMAESAGWQTPAWGTWPEVGGLGADWTPSPTHHSPSGGTIISISPAGSLNSRRGRGSPFWSGAKAQTPTDDVRRGSDASLLGFNLNSPDRRRLPAARRRSSVMSNGSVMDPVEDARLRNINSMSMLRRRFSEVVEIAATAEQMQGRQDTLVARRIMSQWSPYSDASEAEDDDDTSEIHTAPYIPTPPVQHSVPTVLSNFPLASTAAAPDYADSSSEMLHSQSSSPGSPAYHARPLPRIPRAPPPRTFATPPPPDQPATLLKERSRPTLSRAITDYQFPPRPDVVPTGVAAPRPVLHRSTSTPFFSASANGREAASLLSTRVNAIMPLHRPIPLGVSPLRASLRRQSVVSDGDSRRGSLVESRRPSLAAQLPDRRFSAVKEGDLRRASMDRRLSIEMRRMSLEGRKMSADGRKVSMEGRKLSTAGREALPIGLRMSVDGKQMGDSRSLASPIRDSRRASAASMRMITTVEERRRSSATSRKSSVVSVGEYGYLAPQIVIDAAPSVSPEMVQPVPRFKRNAPPSIVLPEFSFPFQATPTSTTSATGGLASPDVKTPRFNPLDSFLGRASPSPNLPSSPSTVCPLSPLPTEDESASVTPTIPSASPRQSIMDRGRPLSPPEFRESFLPRFRGPSHHSPRSSPVETLASVAPVPPPVPVEQSRAATPPEVPRQVSRKAVPRISEAELIVEERRDQSMRRRSRRGAVGQMEPMGSSGREMAHILEVAPSLIQREASPVLPPSVQRTATSSHRRAISTDHTSRSPPAHIGMGRPPNRRQVTLPAPLAPVIEPTRIRKSHVVFEESTWGNPAHLQQPLAPSSPAVPSSRPRTHSRTQSSSSPAPSVSTHLTHAYGPSPPPRAEGLLPPVPQPRSLEKSVLKRSSVTFSETPQAIPNASGSASRPTVSRASSFTRFFKSRPQSISGPLPLVGPSKPVRPSIRPMSSDVAGMGHSWQG